MKLGIALPAKFSDYVIDLYLQFTLFTIYGKSCSKSGTKKETDMVEYEVTPLMD